MRSNWSGFSGKVIQGLYTGGMSVIMVCTVGNLYYKAVTRRCLFGHFDIKAFCRTLL